MKYLYYSWSTGVGNASFFHMQQKKKMLQGTGFEKVLTRFPMPLLPRPVSTTTRSCTWSSSRIRSIQGTTACCPGTWHFNDTKVCSACSRWCSTQAFAQSSVGSLWVFFLILTMLQANMDGSHGLVRGMAYSVSCLSITATLANYGHPRHTCCDGDKAWAEA